MIKDSKRIPKMTAGLDLGDKHSYLCLIDTDTGQLVEESHLRNTPDSAELAKAYPTPQQRRVAVPKHDLLHRLKRLWPLHQQRASRRAGSPDGLRYVCDRSGWVILGKFLAYQERSNLGGIARTFGARNTVTRCLKKAANLAPLSQTLSAAPPSEEVVLELDELWSFVGKKAQKRWVWFAMVRHSRQVLSYAIGDRSEQTCLRLWQRIPEDKHEAVGKESGEAGARREMKKHLAPASGTLFPWR